jgi:hypothetical protein
VVPSEDRKAILGEIAADEGVAARGFDCFCEIPQLSGAEPGEPLYACQNDASEHPVLESGELVNGYCYVDAMSTPPVGNPAIASACPATEKRLLRFVGKGKPRQNSMLFITCQSSSEPTSEQCSAER